MYLPLYNIDDLTFAFRCYVYFRWHTHRRRQLDLLTGITTSDVEAIHPEIHILELTSSNTEVAMLASLEPRESVSTAASKLKGATSKLLTARTGDGGRTERTLGRGYFGATTGSIDSARLDAYLDNQADHHGYDHRYANPPIWVQNWEVSQSDLDQLQTKHAFVSLRWHIVLATFNRVGMLTSAVAQAVSDLWEKKSFDWKVRFQKVSTVPDHIHAAMLTHPSVAPAQLAVQMMNSSQELMHDEFPDLLIHGGQPMLWRPSAYVGSFGDLTKRHVRNYLHKWERTESALGRLA
jgi:REP element-mobilizing transposase RayT